MTGRMAWGFAVSALFLCGLVVTALRVDGTRWALLHVAVGVCFLGMWLLAVCEYRRQRAALRQAWDILQNIQVGLHIYKLEDPGDDRTLRMVYANPASETLSGYRCADIIGRTLDDNFPTLRAMHVPQRYARVARGGTSENFEDIHYGEGQEIRAVYAVKAFPLPDHHVGVSFDNTTGHKQRELELMQAHKLEAVGQLAAGIAHEINTPVQFVGDSIHFIKTSVESLLELLPLYREAWQSLEGRGAATLKSAIAEAEGRADLAFLREHLPLSLVRSTDGVARIGTIVKAMKEFSYKDEAMGAAKHAGDLNHIIETVITISRHEYKYVADVVFEPGDIPLVYCRIDEISQVILNIVVNAAHAIADVIGATGERGMIKIRTSCQHNGVRIDVSDTGNGIPDSIGHRVFDPFFTTKPVGKGTGQGLPLARASIVGKHGGKLTFNAVEGKGTTFTVWLPVNDNVRDEGAP